MTDAEYLANLTQSKARTHKAVKTLSEKQLSNLSEVIATLNYARERKLELKEQRMNSIEVKNGKRIIIDKIRKAGFNPKNFIQQHIL